MRVVKRRTVLVLAALVALVCFVAPMDVPGRQAPSVPRVLAREASARPAADVAPDVTDCDASISSMMEEMTTDILVRYVSELSGEQQVSIGYPPALTSIETRFSYAPQLERAAEYLVGYYESLDMAVEVQRYPEHDWPNVIATLPGSREPDKVVILSAHFDDTSEEPFVRAPGADDNASGTAVVMAAAAILREHVFAYTIRFAHFSGEEQGMLGSAAYAQRERDAGTKVIAVVNLDMIAWDDQGSPVVEVHAGLGAENQPIADAFAGVVDTYGLPLMVEIVRAGATRSSDHSSFWDAGYPAVLVIEDFQDFNPSYHSTDDTVSRLNLSYFTAIARASLATVGLLSEEVWEPVATFTPTPTWTPIPSATPTLTPTTTWHRLYLPIFFVGSR